MGKTPVERGADARRKAPEADAARPNLPGRNDGRLSEADMASFEALVARSLLPVDDAFLGRNLDAFSNLLSLGFPADAILQAYDYAAYQHDLKRRTGGMKPMHLLHWLESNADGYGNVGYVMRARAWAKPAKQGSVRVAPRDRRRPRLTCCRDRGKAVWFVDDDHGSRRVEGTEGVEDVQAVRVAYERMYAREERAAA